MNSVAARPNQAALNTPTVAMALLCVQGLVVLFIQLRGFNFAGIGLDPSWMQVLEHGALSHWQWGRDIVFTFGPLGYLSPGLFHVDTAAQVMLWQLMLAAGWMLFFTAFSPLRGLVLTLLALPAVIVGVDHLALALPFAAAVLWINGSLRRALVLFLLAGFAGNVKFSSLIAVVALAGLTDLAQLRQLISLRRPPVSLFAVVGFLVGYLLAGQSLANLPSFLISSLAMASGYSDAMVQEGKVGQIGLFLALAGLAGVIALATGQRGRRWQLMACWTLTVFLLFKFGYVRHADPRHFQALAGLTSMALLMLVACVGEQPRRWELPVLALFCLLATFSTLTATPDLPTVNQRLAAGVQRIANRWNLLADLTSPAHWKALAVRRQRTDAQVAAGWEQEPSVTIDALGWNAGSALMSGADYQPRPIYQSYAAYTPLLARLNLQAWQQRPPERLLFQSTGIDRWWPGLADGELHPLLQRRYRVKGNEEAVVRLELDQPVECLEESVQAQTASLGQWVELPTVERDAVRYLRLGLTPSFLSLLRKTFFKSRVAQIEARLADGTIVEHKFPRSFSDLWFPLSPMIRRGDERLLFQPALAQDASRVSAFRLLADSGLEDSFSWELRDIRCPQNQDDWISSLIASAVFPHKMAPKFEYGAVFAHAPMLFQLPVQSLAGVRLAFGIRDGAWKQGDTDGVRFDLVWQEQNGAERLLSSRTLKPKGRQADRGDQEMVVDFPTPQSGILMIGILPLENTGWDWSYIRQLDLQFSAKEKMGN